MPTHQYAEVNGTRLRYMTTGEGKLLLFVAQNERT